MGWKCLCSSWLHSVRVAPDWYSWSVSKLTLTLNYSLFLPRLPSHPLHLPAYAWLILKQLQAPVKLAWVPCNEEHAKGERGYEISHKHNHACIVHTQTLTVNSIVTQTGLMKDLEGWQELFFIFCTPWMKSHWFYKIVSRSRILSPLNWLAGEIQVKASADYWFPLLRNSNLIQGTKSKLTYINRKKRRGRSELKILKVIRHDEGIQMWTVWSVCSDYQGLITEPGNNGRGEGSNKERNLRQQAGKTIDVVQWGRRKAPGKMNGKDDGGASEQSDMQREILGWRQQIWGEKQWWKMWEDEYRERESTVLKGKGWLKG